MQKAAFPMRNLVVSRTAPTPPETVAVLQLYDRRKQAWELVDWVLQADLERVLFSNETSTSAVYRLLSRSPGYGDTLRGSLSLRRSSIGTGLITTPEWEQMKSLAHPSVRVMTLVPVESAKAAILTHGKSDAGASLLSSLNAMPTNWSGTTKASIDEGEEGGEEVEEDGEEEGEDEGEEEGEEEAGEEAGEEGEEEGEEEGDEHDGVADGGKDKREDGEGGGEGTGSGSEGEDDEVEGAGHERGGRGQEDDSVAETEVEDNDDSGDEAGEVENSQIEMDPQLTRDLAAFARYRRAPLNIHRGGSAVVMGTTGPEATVLKQFFTWMRQRGNIISFGALFSSASVAATVQMYLNECRERGVKFSTCAKRAASCLNAAKFVYAVGQANATAGKVVPTTAVDQLTRLHC